ncbi:hypothetical protein K469DRAFT_679615 [Zopfia rhizophila CBS 207.26]|uniref:DUF7918 domain-containing protein n=1 Tax=Zopfia rhizophila CBS 207.26 TaxID=1314779 RepID=A0A6A6D8B8_9PEZI|nr:hypothetical protein K469DRAFT_679615 [Zopfia rhizophila CBS 207.26]
MPTYRSINVELRSQYDIDAIPEYFPKPYAYYIKQGITADLPSLVDEKTSTCSVYVPVLPSSQFWISYSVSPPVEDKFFLFKLFINGTHIVSWSTGKNDGWKGKTMFGLYEREEGEDGKKRFEKRALCFTDCDKKDRKWKGVTNAYDAGAYMEVKVHRASGRRRIPREADNFKETFHATHGRGIGLINAGHAGGEQPKRFYKFALIDPVDQPFATFRYYYRTWEQIRDLGLFDDESDVSSMSLIEPYSFEPGGLDPQKKTKEECEMTPEDSREESSESEENDTPTPSPRAYYIPSGAPESSSRLSAGSALSDRCSEKPEPRRHSGGGTPPRFYQLSVPSSLRLAPPEPSKDLPSIPKKSDSLSSLAYRPHPAYPVEDWTERTPSPAKSIIDGISTPPLDRKRGIMAVSLMSVVTNALRRRGAPSSEFVSETGSRTASRNVS